MFTLVINAGSSSLRFVLFDEKLNQIYKGHVDAIGQKHCHYRRYLENCETKEALRIKNHEEAVNYALRRLTRDKAVSYLEEIKHVVHRVVHGGEFFIEPTKLTAAAIRKIKKLSHLAPLHNPANLEALKACMKSMPRVRHTAIFDTAFHSTLPERAFLYGLPYPIYKKRGIRRFGFHGTSHAYVAREAEKILRKKSVKLITCHIGNGVSLCAIKNGKSLDTSMGFTPLEGPPMGTRSGTIDPAIIFYLLRSKMKPTDIENLLEKESGFKGLSEIGSDVRSLWAKSKSAGTKRTFDVFSYQMAKFIASYFIPLGGLPDAIVFTAGIGENAFYLRKQICDYLVPLGVRLDTRANQSNKTIISNPKSTINIMVIPSKEELAMAELALAC